MALPHALATGSDQPYSARFGPRLYCWKRQPQKKAAPAQHDSFGQQCDAAGPHEDSTAGALHASGINPRAVDQRLIDQCRVGQCCGADCSPTTQKKTVSQKTRSWI